MGCGASHDALAHSPVALHHHEMEGERGRFSRRNRGLKLLPEPEREVEQLVNHVNLGAAAYHPPPAFFPFFLSRDYASTLARCWSICRACLM